MIRLAKRSDIPEIKTLVDSVEEMDVIPETFSESYYTRILRKGILLVAVSDERVVGACFGTCNANEGWADLVGVVVKNTCRKGGIGSALLKKFEDIVRHKKLKTIDLYADANQIEFFRRHNYKEGRTYTAFRKRL